MRRVSDILASKPSPQIHIIGPDDTVFAAIKAMEKNGIGALLVLQDGALIGIVTERDYTRKIAVRSRKSRTTPVRAIMSTPVVSVGLRHTSDDCLLLMAKHQFRHLPVMDAGKLAGMISIRDLVDEIIADRRLLDVDQAVPVARS
ncbi:MAG TPA: CBS domain-containing protein [Casimicrobiaceae bacterium]|nr:CBS domain-containing protein [Casimicrobiaceae bacterium]